MSLSIRVGVAANTDEVLALFDTARQFMREHGNTVQWVNGYPSREVVVNDIEQGRLMVCQDTRKGELVAAFCMQTEPEPTYEKIFDGAWPDDEPYGTIHRLGCKYQGRGIGGFCINWVQQRFDRLRADTHETNIPMQRMLEREGFTRCGIIYVDDGTPRLAYHWVHS